MVVFDTHTHLNAAEFAHDLSDVLARAAAAGVRHVLCVGVDLESSRRAVELAQAYPGRVHAAVGIHPNHWAQAGRADVAAVEALAERPEVLAVGETGLDFHHNFTDAQDQVEGLLLHVRLAREVGKPLIVHARKADDRLLAVLSEAGGQMRGIRHCFDRSLAVAERYLELGFHVSLAAHVTRPGYKKLKAAARALPADRILVETDCPYQAPASRAGSRNEPAFILESVEALAALGGEDPADLAAATTANAVRLLRPGE